MMTGLETIVDARGCSADALRNLRSLRSLCERIVSDLALQVVGQAQWHAFPEPGGVTGLYLLSESHLACHTYPEFGLATFNLYCCRERAVWDWRRSLARELGAERIDVRVIARGEDVSMASHDGDGLTATARCEPNASVFPRGGSL
jgi:S-adenosylmethionine decarboxylase